MPSLDTPDTSWQPVTAKVTSCRRTFDTWFVDEANPDETGTYHLAKFLVRFSYRVGERLYAGRFVAGAPRTPGDAFQITVNPRHPEQHTGSDPKRSLLAHLLIWSLGIAGAALLIHFFPDMN